MRDTVSQSSTRYNLTETRPVALSPRDAEITPSLELPPGPGRIGEGGLRKEGLYKQSLPEKPLITVVTIVYNGAEHLGKTIDSIFSQDYDNVEYIVIDGGSTDGTLDIIKKYVSGIDYWISEPDKGISDAFNKGISASSGEWLNFLNAGDCYIDSSVLRDVAGMTAGRDIITGVMQCGERRIPKGVLKNSDWLVKRSMIGHQSSWVHRRVFESTGYFSLLYKMRMDYEFWLRALEQYDFYFTDRVFIEYDPDGISGSDMHRYYHEECRANRRNISLWFVFNALPLLKLLVKRIFIFFGWPIP